MYRHWLDDETATALFFLSGRMTDEEVETHCKHLQDLRRPRASGSSRFAVLLVVDQSPDARQRKAIAEAMKGRKSDWILAFVARSALARGAMRAINWMVRPLFELESFDRVESAIEWLDERRGNVAALRVAAQREGLVWSSHDLPSHRRIAIPAEPPAAAAPADGATADSTAKATGPGLAQSPPRRRVRSAS
jgi:hypothetical protein